MYRGTERASDGERTAADDRRRGTTVICCCAAPTPPPPPTHRSAAAVRGRSASSIGRSWWSRGLGCVVVVGVLQEGPTTKKTSKKMIVRWQQRSPTQRSGEQCDSRKLVEFE